MIEERTLKVSSKQRRLLKPRSIQRRSLKLGTLERCPLKPRVFERCTLKPRVTQISLSEVSAPKHGFFQMSEPKIDQIFLRADLVRVIDVLRLIEIKIG